MLLEPCPWTLRPNPNLSPNPNPNPDPDPDPDQVPNEIAMRAKLLMQEQPNRTFVSAYAEALVLLLNDR
eukprot:scaffold27888_cov37-Phaeocystis_antarctica.AAC.2